MKKILVTGAAGQIGSELTMALRERYGNDNVVAGINRTQPGPVVRDSGPMETVDCTDIKAIGPVVTKYKIDTIIHLAAILSAVAEAKAGAQPVGLFGCYGPDQGWLARYAREAKSAAGFAALLANWLGEDQGKAAVHG